MQHFQITFIKVYVPARFIMADDKLKVIFDEQPLIPFSENDADYLKQFLISIIKNGLNNENITHMYFEQNGVESKKEK